MKYLLDTHAFLWWASEPQKLSKHAEEICNSKKHELILSVASVWEIALKVKTGKLKFNMPLESSIQSVVQKNKLTLLPIEATHVYGLQQLPDIHKDPFDRLLIAQAITTNASLISVDRVFAGYPVTVVW